MSKYEFRGFSESQGAYIQGAVQAVVFGPAGRESDAVELATLIADGCTRKSAAERMSLAGGKASGLRVISAQRVR